MAKIDIVVPCYNYGRFLSACISSILEQSVRDLRVLVIDDASPDDTRAVAGKLAEADPRVGLISHSKNRGHIQTYNEGIAWASAEYFMILSADDLLAPGALKRASDILDTNPDIVLTCGRSIEWDGCLPVPVVKDQHEYAWVRRQGLDLVDAYCSSGRNLVLTQTVLARTCVQKAVGGYRTSLPHSGDMEMWLRFAANGPVACLDAVQAIYRLHSSNMSHLYWSDRWPDYQQRKAAFDSFFAEYADHLPGARILQTQAARALAERAFWDGVAQLCRGNIGVGRRLLRFAIDLRPSLRYWPPMARLLQLDLDKHFASVLSAILPSLLPLKRPHRIRSPFQKLR